MGLALLLSGDAVLLIESGQLSVALPEYKLPTTLKLLFQLHLSYIYTVPQGVPHEHRHHRCQRQHRRHGRPAPQFTRTAANSATA